MTDAQVRAWIAPAAAQIAAGGSLGILACLLLLVFAQGWSVQLRIAGSPPWAARLADASITITAAALAVGAVLQVIAGLSALPTEHTAQPSLSATLLNLCGGLATSGWILLLPAVLAPFLAPRRQPRSTLVISAVAGIPLVLCLAIPPISWAPAAAWLIAVPIAGLLTSAAVRRAAPPSPTPTAIRTGDSHPS